MLFIAFYISAQISISDVHVQSIAAHHRIWLNLSNSAKKNYNLGIK